MAGEPSSETKISAVKGDAPMATFPDVLDRILSSPRHWLAAVGFMAAIFMFAGASMLVFIHFTASSLELSPEGKAVLTFRSRTTGVEEYVVMVHPHGWQRAGIDVDHDELDFAAFGTIQIDLDSLMQQSIRRAQFEAEVKQKGFDPKTQLPEDMFSQNQWNELELPRPWIGPEGQRNLESRQDTAFPSRTPSACHT